MTEVTVEASKIYRVIIGEGMLPISGSMIHSQCGGTAACVVCGDAVDGLYAGAVCDSLRRSGYEVCRFVYPRGEKSKNAGTYIELLNFLAENRLSRDDVIVPLGGGVTGDLAGFAAATYMRGIKYVQMPTTLLAMVDSSVGGKTAIDLPAGKNLAGAFWQPELVICSCDTLSSLPEEIFRDGCAEIVKYAVLRDPELLEMLASPKENIETLVSRCVSIKRDFVNADEHDRGQRQMLNLGHTVGHAAEKLSNFSLSHGRAVATGLAVICRAACAAGECGGETVSAVISALEKLGLPTRTDFTAAELSEIMMSDKKRAGDTINLIVPRSLGSCGIRSLPASCLAAYIEKGL